MQTKLHSFRFLIAGFFIFITNQGFSQTTNPPKALIVIAHPDDETGFAATVYKITKEQKGIVDLCVITNGEGGYKYSTLAESYYGLELTDEKVGRAHLPGIRKKELMNAGGIIGVRNFFFLDQKDAHYGLDPKEPLDTSWDVSQVKRRLSQILSNEQYDFVFCLLPVPETHGGHKAATILALESVKALPAGVERPVVLGASVSTFKDTTVQRFHILPDYPVTQTKTDTANFHFNRAVPFGFKKKLNYKLIVNWEIAEHKSQGTMQLAMNMGDLENFWFFDMNDPKKYAKCEQFFESLKAVPYKEKTYR